MLNLFVCLASLRISLNKQNENALKRFAVDDINMLLQLVNILGLFLSWTVVNEVEGGKIFLLRTISVKFVFFTKQKRIEE